MSEVLNVAAAYVAGYDAGRADASTVEIVDDHALAGELEDARARIAELEAQLAARPAVTGVVVTDEMTSAAYRVLLSGPTLISVDLVSEMLTAALRTATTVPLASAEVALHETATRGTTPMRTPLYRGIAEPAQRGEASDAES